MGKGAYVTIKNELTDFKISSSVGGIDCVFQHGDQGSYPHSLAVDNMGIGVTSDTVYVEAKASIDGCAGVTAKISISVWKADNTQLGTIWLKEDGFKWRVEPDAGAVNLSGTVDHSGNQDIIQLFVGHVS